MHSQVRIRGDIWEERKVAWRRFEARLIKSLSAAQALARGSAALF